MFAVTIESSRVARRAYGPRYFPRRKISVKGLLNEALENETLTTSHLTLMMTSALVVETSATLNNSSSSQSHPRPGNHTTQATDNTSGFKPFTELISFLQELAKRMEESLLIVNSSDAQITLYLYPRWDFIC